MPTVNNSRSSIGLRNRTISSKNQLTDSPKATKEDVLQPTDNNIIRNIKSFNKTASKTCKSPLIVQAQAQFNVSPSQNSIKNDIIEIKKSIESLREDLMNSISEADNKENYYKNIVSKLQCEIKDIKTFNLFLLTQIRVGNFTNHNYKHNLGFYRMHDDNDLKNQITDLSRISIDDSHINQFMEALTSKNNDLSNEIMKIKEELNKVNIANNITHSQSNGSDNEQDIDNRITALENSIDDINISIKNIDEKCIKSNEAWPIMNNQIHVLSAKFINFNSKMNEFIYDNKNKGVAISNGINIIDKDVVHFTTHEQPLIDSYEQINPSKHSKKKIAVTQMNSKNYFVSSDMINHRIHGISNKLDFTRCIKVAMKNTHILDLNTLPDEIHRYFDLTLGMNITEYVNINKFSMSMSDNENNVIDSAAVYVTFKDPLSYDFLCNFKFPSNWFFITTKKVMQNR